MKKILLVCCLALCTSFALQASVDQPELQTIDTKQPAASYMYSNPLIFAAVYGALSGCLCRQFERYVLADIIPFRLCNLFFWGAVERAVIKDYNADLGKYDIPHSDSANINLARVVSWLAYLSSYAA